MVLGACLRNRLAIARWLADRVHAGQRPPVIAIIAAGERWPDDSLRLVDSGFGHDVAVAAALDTCASVPMLADDRFVDASRMPG